MHPRLTRTLGILILAGLVWMIALAYSHSGDDSSGLYDPPAGAGIAEAIGALAALTTLGCIILIAIGMIRGSYSRASDD